MWCESALYVRPREASKALLYKQESCFVNSYFQCTKYALQQTPYKIGKLLNVSSQLNLHKPPMHKHTAVASSNLFFQLLPPAREKVELHTAEWLCKDSVKGKKSTGHIYYFNYNQWAGHDRPDHVREDAHCCTHNNIRCNTSLQFRPSTPDTDKQNGPLSNNMNNDILVANIT